MEAGGEGRRREAFHDEQLFSRVGDADKKGSNADWKEVFVCIYMSTT